LRISILFITMVYLPLNLFFLFKIEKEVIEIVPNKGLIGKQFRQDGKLILDALAAISPEELTEVDKALSNPPGYVCHI